ncbi:hypothetical protein ACT691_12635 [Vibrio metschnikovii]
MVAFHQTINAQRPAGYDKLTDITKENVKMKNKLVLVIALMFFLAMADESKMK